MRRGIAWALAILLAAAGSACGGGSGTATTPAAGPSAVQVSAASALPAGCGTAQGSALDAYTANAAVQPQVAAAPANAAQVYGVWEQDRWNAIGARVINLATSADGGASWSAVAALPFSACGGGSFDRASDPSVAVGQGGVVLASALGMSAANYLASGGQSAVLVSRSTDGGRSWASPQAVISDVGAGTGPWYFNDRDALAADPAAPYAYLVWDRLNSTSGSSVAPTWMARSTDGGATWEAARVIYDPGIALYTQTFNNQPLVLPDGSVAVLFTQIGFATQLACIRSTDHGSTWPASGTATVVATLQPVGTANPIAGGPPIRDSSYMAQTAVDPASGTLAAVWQEGSFSGGKRDGIALTLSHDQGSTWSAPRQVNTATAAAAFDPAVHFGSGGRIAVTYYDLRDYQPGSGVLATSLWLVESTDGGSTWTETRLRGPFDLNKAPPADQQAGTTGNALFLGDQQGLAWNGNAWLALDAATNSSGARVFATRLP